MAYSTSLDTTNSLISLDYAKEHLQIDTGFAQVVIVQCTKENAGGGIGGEYFLISSTVDDYYVWLDVDDGSDDPAVANRTGIEVDIEDNDKADTVAAAVQAAVTAVTGMTATVSGATVTITNDSSGEVSQPTAGDSPFTVTEAIAGTSGDVEFDDKITDLINAASWYFNDFTRRKLKAQSITEYHDGDHPYQLFLNSPPVTGLTLYSDADRAFGSTTAISSDDYVLYDQRGEVWLTGTSFINDKRVIKATYTGGYSTIPYDIQEACVTLVEFYYHGLNQQAVNKTTISNDGGSVTLRETIPLEVSNVISRYVRY